MAAETRMAIWVNGERRETAALDVAALIAELGIPSQASLVEHNGLALLREEWPSSSLHDDDRLEIVRFVAGG